MFGKKILSISTLSIEDDHNGPQAELETQDPNNRCILTEKRVINCRSVQALFYNGDKITGMFLFGNETSNESDILTERHLAKINVTATLH